MAAAVCGLTAVEGLDIFRMMVEKWTAGAAIACIQRIKKENFGGKIVFYGWMRISIIDYHLSIIFIT